MHIKEVVCISTEPAHDQHIPQTTKGATMLLMWFVTSDVEL